MPRPSRYPRRAVRRCISGGGLLAATLAAALAPAALSSSVSPPSITLNVSGVGGDGGGTGRGGGGEPRVLTGDTEGTTLTCSASNNAKPPLSNSVSVTIKIDKTAPRLSDVSVTPGNGSNLVRWKSTSRSDTVRIERFPRRGKAEPQ